MQDNNLSTSPEDSCGGDSPEVLRKLCEQWVAQLGQAKQANILQEVNEVISGLEHFKDAVRTALPIEMGGFGGWNREGAIEVLRAANVRVYETEAGYFGYTGCDADMWDHFDDALSAALCDNAKVRPDMLQLPIKGEVQA